MLEKVNTPADLKNLNIKELAELTQEIRAFLVDTVSKTGGHLSSNLGVAELTVALHSVFDSPKDKFIFDVGHQSYVHKVLTGRKDAFHTLRQAGGLSGFPRPSESPHDAVHAGHSSTSLSISAGFARARQQNGSDENIIAIIGDGAFTSGIVYEALNDIAHNNLPVIIILNDNEMSISHNVGGISKYFKKLRISASYDRFKRQVADITRKRLPFGRIIAGLIYRIKEGLKKTVVRNNFFEDMGLTYYGPVDGNDLKELLQIFKEVRGINRPVIIHAVTKKGKGYEAAEENPGKYHGIAGVCVNGEGSVSQSEASVGYSEVLGDLLTDLGKKDDKIVAITAAMKSGTGLKPFADAFPDRFVDVGIAESHAVTLAYGLSLAGYKPVVAIYSTFLQRAYDQLVHDVGIGRGKVLFCIDRAGLVPGDGETHQGVFDIAYLRTIPHFTILLPATLNEFKMMVTYSIENLDGPTAIRYPKESACEIGEYTPKAFPVKKGEGVIAYPGKDMILVSTGSLLSCAFQVKNFLKTKNIDAEIFNTRFAKPINNTVIDYLCGDGRPVFIIEEGIQTGGVAEYLALSVLQRKHKKLGFITLPDEFPGIGSRSGLLDAYNLTVLKIGNKILKEIFSISVKE